MIYVWLGLIVAFFIIEAFTMDLFGVWFIFGALASFITALFISNVGFQIIIFFIVSFSLLLFTRPVAKKYFTPRKVRTNIDRIIGQKAMVLKSIKPLQNGEVKVDGKIWTAYAETDGEIKEGDIVVIVSIQGAKLFVKNI